MIRWRDINPVWKVAVGYFLVIVAIVAVFFFCSGCSSTVRPKPVASSTIAFDGAEQNAGVLEVWPGKGALITEAKKAEYDALVRLYGRGTVGHPLVPAISDDLKGMTRLNGKDMGYPLHEFVWFMDPEQLTDFLLFKAWLREGRAPL